MSKSPTTLDPPTPSVVCLIPAYNEAGSIGDTLTAIARQDRLPDLTVVIANGCSDDTAAIARGFNFAGLVVLDLPRLPHRKAEALNIGWSLYAKEADIVICLDADTVLPPQAVADWEKELTVHPDTLGGSSSKFTMLAPDFLSRLQKAEFATWTQTALDRGETSVLAGTGAAINNRALQRIAARPDRQAQHSAHSARCGPWSYESATEDFELTYRIRELGYKCQVSPTVRAYTDSMKTVRSLWGQRMKWQVGTIEDLCSFGLSRLTWRDWMQQGLGLLNTFSRLLWVAVIAGLVLTGTFTFIWFWWMLPVFFIALDLKRALRIPHRDAKDLLIALTLLPNELFMWLRGAWFFWSWATYLRTRITRESNDLWAAQYRAEAA